VLTAQKRQPQVQVSPMTIKVAVPPLQHSPMLGQRASSQTVESFSSRARERMRLYRSPPGILTLSQGGLLERDMRGLRDLRVWPFPNLDEPNGSG